MKKGKKYYFLALGILLVALLAGSIWQGYFHMLQKNVAAYHKVLDQIKEYEEGTAGSSLKIAIVAANLLNYTEQAPLSQKKLKKETKAYISDLTEIERGSFQQNFIEVDQMALEILGKKDHIQELLDDAGNPQKYDTYSMKKYSKMRIVIQEELAQQRSNS